MGKSAFFPNWDLLVCAFGQDYGMNFTVATTHAIWRNPWELQNRKPIGTFFHLSNFFDCCILFDIKSPKKHMFHKYSKTFECMDNDSLSGSV